MLHHSTEYRLNGGAWIQVTPDEVAGSGKTFTISGLVPGSYNVEMRLTPLVGGGPSVVSNSFTLTVVSGNNVAQIQAVQSESSSGSLKFIATSAQSQSKNAEQVSSLLLFIGSIAQAQIVQSESGSTSSNVLGSVSESQSVQSESVSGIQTFSGSASQSQNKQTNAATSAETFVGSVAVSQNKQASVIVSYETFSGTVAESQQKQVELVSGNAAGSSFTATVTQAQRKQTQYSMQTGYYTFDGVAGTPIDTYSSFFTKSLVGSGSANLDGSGRVLINNPIDANDGALVYRTNAIALNQTKTIRVGIVLNSSFIGDGNGGTALQLIHAPSKQAPLGSGSDDSISMIDWVVTRGDNVLGTFARYFDNLGNKLELYTSDSTWGGVGEYPNDPAFLVDGILYFFYLYITPVGWSIELRDGSNTVLISKTNEIAWSSTVSVAGGESVWLRIGDKYCYAWEFGLYLDQYLEV